MGVQVFLRISHIKPVVCNIHSFNGLLIGRRQLNGDVLDDLALNVKQYMPLVANHLRTALSREIKDEIERAVVHLRIILGEVIRILGADKFLVCLYLFVNHNVMPSK